MILLKFNTGNQVVVFGPFLDDTDGITNELSLAISAGNINLHKANALVLSTHSLSGATHSASGLYTVTLGTGDTDVYGPMTGYIDVTGALATKLEFLVMEVNAYNALAAALGTGHIEADLQKMGGVAQSATDLKDFADAGYDPGTNKVQGVVLVDTCTTNTDLVSAAAVVNEWETQSQADPTGFHVNVLEVNGTAQTANDNGADINTLITQIGTAGAGLTDLGGMSAGMKGEVNAEVDIALVTTTYGEPGDEIPAATSSLGNKIDYIFKFLRNKVETTSTRIHVYDDAGTNKDHSSTISDDATTFIRGEFRAGDA